MSRCGCENNINMDLKSVGDVGCIHPPNVRNQSVGCIHPPNVRDLSVGCIHPPNVRDQSVGCYVLGNERWVSINGMEHLGQMSSHQLLKVRSAPWNWRICCGGWH
jgi:hypothetical protein